MGRTGSSVLAASGRQNECLWRSHGRNTRAASQQVVLEGFTWAHSQSPGEVWLLPAGTPPSSSQTQRASLTALPAPGTVPWEGLPRPGHSLPWSRPYAPGTRQVPPSQPSVLSPSWDVLTTHALLGVHSGGHGGIQGLTDLHRQMR